MKPITFCIPTAKNEKEYIRLLLNSLKDHTNIHMHEVLVFVDTDNQNTYEMLVDYKKIIPNLRIYRNTESYQIGGQRNISIMFNAAKNDIVCYLQSDMVVGKDFDKHIINSLVSDSIVLACTRIEPPLHPASPEKFVKNFGVTPEDFDYNAFNAFVEEVQSQDRPDTDGHFAPFALYKRVWIDKLGGFDTQFRCSREDSDAIIRMKLHNLKMIQSWKACVYHFTCVSSRGKDWFKTDSEANYKNEIQQQADQQELRRFIRKWGFFGHEPRAVYNIAFVVDLDMYADINILKFIEPYCKKLYLSDSTVAAQLISQIEFDSSYYSNLRWGYASEHWEKVKEYFNPTKFDERIQATPIKINDDVVVTFKYSDLRSSLNNQQTREFIERMNEIVHASDPGTFQGDIFTVDIKNKIDMSNTYKKYNVEQLLDSNKFKFT